MKHYWKFSQALGILCFIGACFMFVLNAIAVIAASFGLVQPFDYFHYLGVPYWAVALPALGILMFFPLALREAFTFKTAPVEEKVVEPVDWRRVIDKWRTKLHLKPV
jgi:hypothetical protein